VNTASDANRFDAPRVILRDMSSRTFLPLVLLATLLGAGCQAAHAKDALLHGAATGVAAVVIDANTPAPVPAAVPAAQPAREGTSSQRVLTCRFACPVQAAQRSSTLRS
jgi:hypothetical protein